MEENHYQDAVIKQQPTDKTETFNLYSGVSKGVFPEAKETLPW